jgi:hypothetical protein
MLNRFFRVISSLPLCHGLQMPIHGSVPDGNHHRFHTPMRRRKACLPGAKPSFVIKLKV